MIERLLFELRNTRDFRAEMASLGADLVGNASNGCLILVGPIVSSKTALKEWERLLPAFAENVRRRMTLEIRGADGEPGAQPKARSASGGIVPLDRPNYRFEIVRQLIAADLQNESPTTIGEMLDAIGASQTPIRHGLAGLKQAGLVRSTSGGAILKTEDVSQETLAKLRAVSQTLRFRFERGAQIKPPATLAQRVLPLLRPDAPQEWRTTSLSGIAAALKDVPQLDVAGLPRLDLVVQVGRNRKSLDTSFLRLLDDGLEPEPNVLAPAPVVVTLVRAAIGTPREQGIERVRMAAACDVYLSLLDAGLRDVANHYAKAVRR